MYAQSHTCKLKCIAHKSVINLHFGTALKEMGGDIMIGCSFVPWSPKTLWFIVFNFRCLSKRKKILRPFRFPFPACLVPQCTLSNLVSTTRHNAFQTAWTHNSLQNVRSALFFAMKFIFLEAILLSSRLLWGEASSWGEVNLLVQTCSLVNKRLISC